VSPVGWPSLVLSHFECPNVEIGKLNFLHDLDADVGIGGGLAERRPVLDAHDLDKVKCLGEHDDRPHPPLPNQPPKIIQSVLEGPLGDNVGIRLKEALEDPRG